MNVKLVGLLTFLTFRVFFSGVAVAGASSRMEAEKVVPDVIDKVPPAVLEIKFGEVAANMGNELTPTQVKNPPTTLNWPGMDANKFYTIAMIDPDAPNRKNPIYREWNHWLVVNAPGNKVAAGESLAEYIGSAPPQGSHLHRYVLLVYAQPGKVKFDEKKLDKHNSNRGNFSIRKFAAKHKLGDPIAGNFFQAQWDSYVPKVYEQLKLNVK